jgi:NAD(P)-dependent dehydrogenase (short-subunit alcohol dehydrogenase family)
MNEGEELMDAEDLQALAPASAARPLLRDRVALIVGGGSGLGRAIAQAFAVEGAELAVADLSLEAARETLGLAGREREGDASVADISDPASCRYAVDRVVERFGRLEILVNCAAICLVDPLLEVTPERWDRVFAVNVRGTFFAMQAAARVMLPRSFGRILNITSPAARMGFPWFASYGASKAAVESLTRSAALAWAARGVTVNAISPGRMTGGMIDKLEEDLARAMGKSLEELKKGRSEGLPMGRRVSPREVAQAAVWLASDQAAYVTAERFNFTGGMELS